MLKYPVKYPVWRKYVRFTPWFFITCFHLHNNHLTYLFNFGGEFKIYCGNPSQSPRLDLSKYLWFCNFGAFSMQLSDNN